MEKLKRERIAIVRTSGEEGEFIEIDSSGNVGDLILLIADAMTGDANLFMLFNAACNVANTNINNATSAKFKRNEVYHKNGG